MKGLELAERYWHEAGAPAIEAACPSLRGRLAVGLVGEGSECLGFDDEISQDHDWGPGFCLWLTAEDFAVYGEELRAAYAALPREYMGFRRLRESRHSQGRVGVFSINKFYERFLGPDGPPGTLLQWLAVSDQALSVCTNGRVFQDELGEFTRVRRQLLNYYPEDVRRKRLAAQCAMAAQAGQYNHPRCLSRGDHVAAMRALGEFIDHAQAVVFLLNRRYRPYYKWAHQAMGGLPAVGEKAKALFEDLAACAPENRQNCIETLSALLIQGLKEQNLSDGSHDFLLNHAEKVQQSIQDSTLRSLPLMLG